MSSDAIATFITVRGADFSTVIDRIQNRWPGQMVNGHRHYPFVTGQITSNSTGGQSGISLELGLSKPMMTLVEQALLSGYFFQVEIKRFLPQANDAPPPLYEVMADFYGEVINASQDATGIQLSVGSNLDPVEAQAPPRKFTTVLCGSPPQL
jgi:hypothetical protein